MLLWLLAEINGTVVRILYISLQNCVPFGHTLVFCLFLFVCFFFLHKTLTYQGSEVCVACRSEKCATLKHVSDWRCGNFVISRTDNNVLLTHCIWSIPTFITEKHTNKHSSLVLILVSLHKFSWFGILHLTGGFDMTIKRFTQSQYKHVSESCIFQNSTQCQSETCFKMAHVSERHATYASRLGWTATLAMFALNKVGLKALSSNASAAPWIFK